MLPLRLLSPFVVLALGAACHAQLVFGSGTSTASTAGAYYLDVDTAKATRLWNGPGSGDASRKVNGLAADTTTGTIYGNDNARMYKWNYGNVGTEPTFVSGFYRRGTNNLVYATGVDDLTFARGGLYAYTNFNALGGVNVEDGIYLVDPTVAGGAAQTNMSLVWRHDDLKYNFKGLAFDPTTSLFYGANSSNGNPTTQNPLGIYAIDLFAPTVTVTKVADFDSFIPAPDGLAYGDGKLWLSGKASGSTNLLIESYDLSTGTYDDPLSFNLGDTGSRSTDLVWAPGALNPVPEPASILVLGLGAAALRRTRRRSAE